MAKSRALKVETSDLGHFIANALGAHDEQAAAVPIIGKSEHGERYDGEVVGYEWVSHVDLSDPDNLVVWIGEQTFTVRIIAGG